MTNEQDLNIANEESNKHFMVQKRKHIKSEEEERND